MVSKTPPVVLPGCKSVSQRSLMVACLSKGTTVLQGLSDCQDTRDLKAALTHLGAGFQSKPDGGLEIQGWGGVPESISGRVDVGEGGSTLRFLLALCAASVGEVEFCGSERLLERNHQPLLDFLNSHGVEVKKTSPSTLHMRTQGLPAGTWQLPGEGSSQFASGLWMVSRACADVEIQAPSHLASLGYFKLTQSVAETMAPDGTLIGKFEIPADASAATFFLAASFLTGNKVTFSTPVSAAHPETRSHKLFSQWKGCSTSEPLFCHVDSFPDAAPALSLCGANHPGGMEMSGIERLRDKESDRVQGMIDLMNVLGIESEIRETRNGQLLWIAGGGIPRVEGKFNPMDDHRLAMSAGIANLLAHGIQIQNPECETKSFPGFRKTLEAWWTA